jgi:hypothetical protein
VCFHVEGGSVLAAALLVTQHLQGMLAAAVRGFVQFCLSICVQWVFKMSELSSSSEGLCEVRPISIMCAAPGIVFRDFV